MNNIKMQTKFDYKTMKYLNLYLMKYKRKTILLYIILIVFSLGVGTYLFISSLKSENGPNYIWPVAFGLITAYTIFQMVTIGLGLEPFITNALSSTFKNQTCVQMSDYVELVELDGTHSHTDHKGGSEDEHSIYDAHIWLDPIAMINMTNAMLDELIKIYPEREDLFRENANNLIKDLEDLNEEYIERLSSEDILNRTIMVDHDAYAYWTFRYGINRIKLLNDNESNEVGTQEFLDKVSEAKEAGIKYIISTKNETKSAMFNQYLKALDASELSLHHLGTITTQELKDGITYLIIMRENLEVLIQALPKVSDSE